MPSQAPPPTVDISDTAEPLDARLTSLLKDWSMSSLALESDMNTKMLHLDVTYGPRQQEKLVSLRRSRDAAGRKAKAEEYKALANAQFGKEAWRIALVGYLAGVWMLRRDKGDPACPKLLTNHLHDLEEAGAAMGRAEAADDAPEDAPEAATLRAALLVNFAAAALKLNEWRLAITACELGLAANPSHAKALWRLAKAYEGDGNLTEAMTTASRLISADPSNKDAPKLLESLQKRKAKHGKMFGSFVERAHEEGDTLYTMKEQQRDVSEAMQLGFVRCMGRPNPGEESDDDEEEKAPEAEGGEEGEEGAEGDQGAESEEEEEAEEEQMTDLEHMESLARAHYLKKIARGPKSEDMQRLDKVMYRAYMQTRDMREEGVRVTLPPSVLASYVDETLYTIDKPEADTLCGISFITCEDGHVEINTVVPGFPADEAGLQEMLHVKAVNGQAVTSHTQGIELLKAAVGKVVIKAVKPEQPKEKPRVKPKAKPAEQPAVPVSSDALATASPLTVDARAAWPGK